MRALDDPRAAPQPQPTGQAPAGSSILIVDDRPDNLMALETALAPLGEQVIRADSGEAALRTLLKREIAVILLDVQMPGLDGFETAAYIKRLDRTKHIPIIFLTAIDKDAQHVFRGYSAGAVDYLFKPFDPSVLRSKVAVFIDLHRKKHELETSEDRFRKAFDHAPIGVALVGTNGALLKVNRALQELTGLDPVELVTRSVHDLFEANDESLRLDAMAEEMRSGASWHAERRILRRDGSNRHALVSVSFIPAAPGTRAHFICQITDITERKELEAFRERFVSHAAHELRTPASVIAGIASLLQDDGLEEDERNRCVNALNRQSQRLATMVHNLLDLARLREGRQMVELRSLDVRTALEKALEDDPPPDGISVELDIEDACTALADPEAVAQIISNLLVNAYRYGGNRIRVAARRTGERISIDLSDNGPGVPSEMIPKLFEPFARGRESSRVGGSGLGLSLVKSLAEAGGGEVRYRPLPDGGAGFEVLLVMAS